MERLTRKKMRIGKMSREQEAGIRCRTQANPSTELARYAPIHARRGGNWGLGGCAIGKKIRETQTGMIAERKRTKAKEERDAHVSSD